MNNLSNLETLIETRGVLGAYLVGSDGFLLGALNAGTTDPEHVAAVSAICAMASEGMGQGLGLRELQWILLEFKHGTMIISRRKNMIFVVAGNRHMVIGDVLMKLQSIQQNEE
ncbi:MAG: hypothetical protein GF401_06595 [Chitinivibrionales bacterium]|nr:hypothetical protein [Chitinivibrionales bacterium]